MLRPLRPELALVQNFLRDIIFLKKLQSFNIKFNERALSRNAEVISILKSLNGVVIKHASELLDLRYQSSYTSIDWSVPSHEIPDTTPKLALGEDPFDHKMLEIERVSNPWKRH